ncbi:hypothetical protein LBMAG27_09510 [Bacteroidota bacterium]|nr:hypothetical protein LBMAG27_09510 [Bacteroidota bacterium]
MNMVNIIFLGNWFFSDIGITIYYAISVLADRGKTIYYAIPDLADKGKTIYYAIPDLADKGKTIFNDTGYFKNKIRKIKFNIRCFSNSN